MKPKTTFEMYVNYSSSLHQSPGRNTLIQPMETIMGSLSMDVTTSDHLGSDSFTRDSQHQGGCPLPSMAAVLRVDVEPSYFLTSGGQMPDLSIGGSVRLTGEQPNSDVLQPVPSRSSVARECFFIPVEGTRLLRLPSASTSNSSTTQDKNGGDTIYPTHRSVLASQGLVPQASQVVGGSALQVATTSGPTFSTGPRLTLSRSAGPVLGCLIWPLSGSPSSRRGFRRKLPLWRHRDVVLPPSTFIVDDCDSSENGVPVIRFVRLRLL